MKYSVIHFAKNEFACRCCSNSNVSAVLVFWLDVARRSCGVPLKINSGYRCAGHNANVGGSRTSRHMIGCAADIAKPSQLSYPEFVAVFRRLSSDGWEIVEQPSKTFLHVGVPRELAVKIWDGAKVIEL